MEISISPEWIKAVTENEDEPSGILAISPELYGKLLGPALPKLETQEDLQQVISILEKRIGNV